MLSSNYGRFEDSKRALAKLMAKENITVQFIYGLSTANFDMVARVMSIPAEWLDTLTVAQIDLLVGHETGHALFTDIKYLEALAKARKAKIHPGLMSYFNVVEDARIERKQREAYPGLKASFYDGYRDFTVGGPIFKTRGGKVDGRVVSELSLIDRINVFYKLGAFVKVNFTADEAKWIAEIDKAWSTERAMDIAKLLHELAKDEILDDIEKHKNDPKSETGGESGEAGEPGEESDDEGDGSGDDKNPSKDSKAGDGSDDDDSKDGKDGKDDKGADAKADDAEADGGKSNDGADGDKSGKDSKGKPKKTAEEKAADKAAREALDPESKTDKALADALKKLAEAAGVKPPEEQIRHLLLKPLTEATVKARTITAEAWSTQVMSSIGYSAGASGQESVRLLEERWNAVYLATAENMAQEFLRKKTAKNLEHARVGKSGRLDMNKLHKYRFAEDLFKQVTTVPNGLSHGIVMIIDGSSSMCGVFGSVLDQVLLFAQFTFKANIPFECYMFTDTDSAGCREESLGLQTITLPATGKLVGLVNTVVGRASFKKQIHSVLALRSQFVREGIGLGTIPYSHLGSTPLYAGMMLAERHVERMKRTLRLDKVMTVVISDGQDNGGLVYETNKADRLTGTLSREFAAVSTTAIVVRDTVTKKNHVLVEAKPTYDSPAGAYYAPQNAVMTLLFDVLKDRHGCRNIYMYLTQGRTYNEEKNGYGPQNICQNYLTRAGVKFALHVNDIRKAMEDHNQYVLPADHAVADCTMVIKPSALQLTENEFAGWNAAGATKARIATEFVKAGVKAIANRVFVNSVMPHLT
jgi:hypothetical protein